MYSYIYDDFLNNKKYLKQLKKIENALIDLGIGGKICRLSLFNNIKELIADEVHKGSENIILVGNDKTINKFLNILVEHKNITIGLIPVGQEQNTFAQLLHIPIGENACAVISKRKIKNIQLAAVNNYHFLRSIHFAPQDGVIECGNNFNIQSLSEQTMCAIINPIEDEKQEGTLRATIEEVPEKSILSSILGQQKNTSIKSVFPLQKIYLKPKPSLSLIIDQQKVIKTPAMITMSQEKINIIVGKDNTIPQEDQ